jgi:hypothetical protein
MLVLKTPHQAYLNKQQRQILNKNSVKWLNKKNTWPEKIIAWESTVQLFMVA